VVVAALGGLIEILLLRRIYRAPELFQLLATFALVLVINDVAQYIWGPEDLLGPRAPGLRWLGRDPRANFPELRPVPDRRKPRSYCCLLT
jgi:branched-subunit amino acid ABC-type transport system permease component